MSKQSLHRVVLGKKKNSNPLIIGIDQGSSHTRATLFTARGKVICESVAPLRTDRPRPGWVEHDPNALLESVLTVIRNLLKKSAGEKIAAIGIANQRSTLVCWDRKTGAPQCPAISWQDQRTASSLSQWDDPAIKEKTGLPLTCYYSATKLNWILNQFGRKKDVIAGTVNTFLIWHLTKGKSHLTDPTNAQRMLLYNIIQKEYDPDLLRHFKIPRNILPEVCCNQADFGEAVIDGIRIPITASIGDQQGSAIGLGGFDAGFANINYGTGGFLLINVGEKQISLPGLLSSIACSDKNKTTYLIEGTVNAVGSLFAWFQQIGLLKSVSKIDSAYRRSRDPAFFLPALTGLGAPYWRSDAKGVLCGLTDQTGPEDIIRGAVEGVSHLMNQIYQAVPDSIRDSIKKIVATGGGAKINSLMQFQADLFGKTISIAADPESTVRGAAFLAGKAAGLTDETRFRVPSIRKTVMPQIGLKERARLIEAWQASLRRFPNPDVRGY
ncbi:MAG: FGGY family carbohydrate kinase [Nitrospirota bacterium]